MYWSDAWPVNWFDLLPFHFFDSSASIVFYSDSKLFFIKSEIKSQNGYQKVHLHGAASSTASISINRRRNKCTWPQVSLSLKSKNQTPIASAAMMHLWKSTHRWPRDWQTQSNSFTAVPSQHFQSFVIAWYHNRDWLENSVKANAAFFVFVASSLAASADLWHWMPSWVWVSMTGKM